MNDTSLILTINPAVEKAAIQSKDKPRPETTGKGSGSEVWEGLQIRPIYSGTWILHLPSS